MSVSNSDPPYKTAWQSLSELAAAISGLKEPVEKLIKVASDWRVLIGAILYLAGQAFGIHVPIKLPFVPELSRAEDQPLFEARVGMKIAPYYGNELTVAGKLAEDQKRNAKKAQTSPGTKDEDDQKGFFGMLLSQIFSSKKERLDPNTGH